jgi:glutamate---cysteine ligase / carboxylate-amine ligase
MASAAGRNGFGRRFTLGVEEELFLVDGDSLEAVPAVAAIVPEPDDRLKYELFQCIVETNTPICADVREALDSMQRLRAEVARRAAREGLLQLAGATHPTAQGGEQPIVDTPRYRKMAAELGDAVQRQIVAGLHVHVGMPDEQACLNAFEGVVGWLPTILALSAASPYAEGEETGARSERAGRLAELPRAAAPPLLPTWAAWEEITAGADYTRMWWDARPHPRYGTVEVRMPDAQPDIRRAAGLAALVQALASVCSEHGREPLDRGVYERRREEAARLPVPRRDLDELGDLVETRARLLGGWGLVEELLASPPEAERQLMLGRAQGLQSVVEDLVDRSQP